jgi:hypothetical protein
VQQFLENAAEVQGEKPWSLSAESETLHTKICGRLSLRAKTQISLPKILSHSIIQHQESHAGSIQQRKPAKFETQHGKTAWNTPENHADGTSLASQ